MRRSIIFIGLIVMSLTICVGCASVSSGKNTRDVAAPETTSSQDAAEHSIYGNRSPSKAASGKPAISISDIVAKASESIRRPSKATVGEPVAANDMGGQLPRNEVGLHILYSKGISFTAQAIPNEEPQDLVSRQKTPTSPFTDKRKHPFDIITFKGMQIGVQRGGEQEGSISGITKVNPAISWQDGDVVYSLSSDALSSDELLEALRSMYPE